MPRQASAPHRAQKRAKHTSTPRRQVKKTQKRRVAPVASAAFAASRATHRINVNWTRAVSPFESGPSPQFTDMQKSLDDMWREVYSAPKSVPKVNFEQYDAVIKNKSALKAIKADYEAAQFKVVKSDYQTKEAADKLVQSAQAEARLMGDLETALKTRIDALKFASTVIPFLTLEEELALTPGLEEEFARQLENGQQLPDINVIKALDYDSEKIKQQLANGILPEFPAEAVNKTLLTPIWFRILDEHADFTKAVKEEYNVTLPNAESIILNSLARQGQRPDAQQIHDHIEALELPFVFSAIPPESTKQ